jgi:hypothetical protein
MAKDSLDDNPDTTMHCSFPDSFAILHCKYIKALSEGIEMAETL